MAVVNEIVDRNFGQLLDPPAHFHCDCTDPECEDDHAGHADCPYPPAEPTLAERLQDIWIGTSGVRVDAPEITQTITLIADVVENFAAGLKAKRYSYIGIDGLRKDDIVDLVDIDAGLEAYKEKYNDNN